MSDVTVAGGGFSSPSVVQSPGMTKSRSGRDDSVRSIVSAQLHSIPLADISSQEIKIDDKELGQVCLVGEIVYVSENSTGTTYKIDDRTGPPIEIKRWISDDESPLEYQNRAACREGIYVKVIGHVRVFGNQRNVVGFFIKPIEDYNEVTHHLVETLFAHLAITKPLPVPEQYSSLANNMGGDTSGWAPMATSTQIGGSSAMYSDGGLTPVQRQVLNIINQCHTADGLHVNEIHSMAAVSGYKDGQIKSAIDFLASEGHIYSTIDDHHFMSTEN
jgi:replication factor A2